MKNSMVVSSVKIINDLKKYLEEISENPIKRTQYTATVKDFIR